jgi:hypothetical protein
MLILCAKSAGCGEECQKVLPEEEVRTTEKEK